LNPSKICPKRPNRCVGCGAAVRDLISVRGSRQRHGMEEEKPTSNAPRLCLLASDSCARLPSRGRPGGGRGPGNYARAPVSASRSTVGLAPQGSPASTQHGPATCLDPLDLPTRRDVARRSHRTASAKWNKGKRRRGSRRREQVQAGPQRHFSDSSLVLLLWCRPSTF
jgi:hypothetical protein